MNGRHTDETLFAFEQYVYTSLYTRNVDGFGTIAKSLKCLRRSLEKVGCEQADPVHRFLRL